MEEDTKAYGGVIVIDLVVSHDKGCCAVQPWWLRRGESRWLRAVPMAASLSAFSLHCCAMVEGCNVVAEAGSGAWCIGCSVFGEGK